MLRLVSTDSSLNLRVIPAWRDGYFWLFHDRLGPILIGQTFYDNFTEYTVTEL